MDVNICHSCGVILHNQKIVCAGCGATASKFARTQLGKPKESVEPSALGVELNPLDMERAVNRSRHDIAMRHVWSEVGASPSSSSGMDLSPPPVMDEQQLPASSSTSTTSSASEGFVDYPVYTEPQSPTAQYPSVYGEFDPPADASPTEVKSDPLLAAFESVAANGEWAESISRGSEQAAAAVSNRAIEDSGQSAIPIDQSADFSVPSAVSVGSAIPDVPAAFASFGVPVVAETGASLGAPPVAAIAAAGAGVMLSAPPVAAVDAMRVTNSQPFSPGGVPTTGYADKSRSEGGGPSSNKSRLDGGGASSNKSRSEGGGPSSNKDRLDDGAVVNMERSGAGSSTPAASTSPAFDWGPMPNKGLLVEDLPASREGSEKRELLDAESKSPMRADIAESPRKTTSRPVAEEKAKDSRANSASRKIDQSRKGKTSSRSTEDSEERTAKPHKRSASNGFDFSRLSLGSNKVLMYGAAGGVALILLFFVFGSIGSLVGTSQAPALTGAWQLGATDTRGGTIKATCSFQQAGAALSGGGSDRYGNFAIAGGQYAYPAIKFAKVYLDASHQPVSKPILYSGQIDWVNPQPEKGGYLVHAVGTWSLTKREGQGWRGQVVTRTGKWEAIMTQSGGGSTVGAYNGAASIGNQMGPMNGGQAQSAGGFLPAADDPQGWPKLFSKIAIVLIARGVGVCLLSVKMFGPAGMLNIWSKKEYIPSQFKSQWRKMLMEFGKPLKTGGLPLGTRADWNPFNLFLPRKLNMPPDVRKRNPHMLLLGSSGKGKSRLMASFIAQDIENADRAVVVIDSDGSLIDLLMTWIAAHPKGKRLAERVVVLDPTRGEEPLTYNPLAFPDDGDMQNAASAVVFGFKAIYTEPPGAQSQWNQQTANILRNAAMLLMANGRTLTDLPVLLSENDFRDILLDKVEKMKHERTEYTTLLEAWNQYKRLARTDQWITWVEPILNRVQPMLGDPRLRRILTQPHSDLKLTDIISEKKILLVKVPQGQLQENAALLGSLLITGLKQSALSLFMKGKDAKYPCALYLDEMENFIEKETFESITSEIRKVQISFVGAIKTLQDWPEDYRSKVLSHINTMCCFAMMKKDADMLGPQMFRVDGRKVKHQTLQNIMNKVNTAPQFELIMDEEKLNIDRIVGQENRTYFCYRVGTVAGVFQMQCPEFNDVADSAVNWNLVDKMYENEYSR